MGLFCHPNNFYTLHPCTLNPVCHIFLETFCKTNPKYFNSISISRTSTPLNFSIRFMFVFSKIILLYNILLYFYYSSIPLPSKISLYSSSLPFTPLEFFFTSTILNANSMRHGTSFSRKLTFRCRRFGAISCFGV